MSVLEICWEHYTQKMWSLSTSTAAEHLAATFIRPLASCEPGKRPRVCVAEFGLARAHVRETVVLKFAWNERERKRLDHEFALYSQELLPLQGRVVPTIFGYFNGHESGQHCSVLVMEYCSGGPARCINFRRPDIQAILAQIQNSHVNVYELLDEAHYVLTGEGEIRVIGFAKAQTGKQSSNAYPTSSNTSLTERSSRSVHNDKLGPGYWHAARHIGGMPVNAARARFQQYAAPF
ncbi:hypothetical protein HDZ31DRAFT_59845 [Schizophyllum fasciatum]